MSGSSLFQGARRTRWFLVTTCCAHWMGSGEALSCWVRMVAKARDENRDKRQGGSTACPSPQVEPKRGENYLVLRLVCAPVSWRVFSWCLVCVGGVGLWLSLPVLCVGLFPSSAPSFVALSGFRPPGFFQQEASTQGTYPKTGFFRPWRAPTQGPIFLQVHSFYGAWAPYVWYAVTVVLDVGCWVATLVYFFCRLPSR